jgi:hypothetical protein
LGQAGKPGVIGSGGGPAGGRGAGSPGAAGGGRGAIGGRGANSGSAGMRGRNGPDADDGRDYDDDIDERTTWLTDDDLVWTDGDPLAPTVLDERSSRGRRG